MNKFQMLFEKVLSGEACCNLEAQEGTGCDFECPYAGTDKCKDNFEADKKRLTDVMKMLDKLVEEGKYNEESN